MHHVLAEDRMDCFKGFVAGHDAAPAIVLLNSPAAWRTATSRRLILPLAWRGMASTWRMSIGS
ncbi:hypothetical protein D3C87_2039880 [compost metagenome]